MVSEIIDLEVNITESNKENVKGELRIENKVIEWYIPLSDLGETLGIPEKDLEMVREKILNELKGASKARIDRWTVPHYIIETNNFIFFVSKEQKKEFGKGACMYLFFKSSHFKQEGYHSNEMLDKLQELAADAVSAIRRHHAIEKEHRRIKEELAWITRFFRKEEVNLSLKQYDTWLRTILVRGRVSIGEFKTLYNISKNAKGMSTNVRALLWLILYEMRKK